MQLALVRDILGGICQVDVIGIENGSQAPRKMDKTAQESAQSAADTLQVELHSSFIAFIGHQNPLLISAGNMVMSIPKLVVDRIDQNLSHVRGWVLGKTQEPGTTMHALHWTHAQLWLTHPWQILGLRVSPHIAGQPSLARQQRSLRPLRD